MSQARYRGGLNILCNFCTYDYVANPFITAVRANEVGEDVFFALYEPIYFLSKFASSELRDRKSVV